MISLQWNPICCLDAIAALINVSQVEGMLFLALV